jgi:hypothetical protein
MLAIRSRRGGPGVHDCPGARDTVLPLRPLEMADCTMASVRYHDMNEVRTRVVVGSDHRISGIAPAEVPVGEHDVTITLTDGSAREQAVRPRDPGDLPRHDLGPWPNGLSLRREDIYSDDNH